MMKKINNFAIFLALLTAFAYSQEADINLGAGFRITDIRYNSPLNLQTTDTNPIDPYTIDRPPIVGFVPYVAISLTNKRLPELEFEAQKETYYSGGSLISNPSENFAIGIFDTGASAHVFGYQASLQLGLTGSHLTNNIMTIGGVSGFVDTLVSQPIGVFFAGLDAVDPNGSSVNLSSMFGQSNTAVVSGLQPNLGAPDLPIVIGSPMAVFYDVAINNDNAIIVEKGGRRYNSPSVSVYDLYDPSSPAYSNVIPLELRPLGAMNVSYSPGFDGIFDFQMNFDPATPSVVMGTASQSLYFVHAVDLEHKGNIAFDKDRFMFDTGAQSTVIGSRVASRLGLNPQMPDFEIQAMGINGEIVDLPGFVIDSIQIPALGNWLTFTNVPVALLDVASPEGGSLDGIIGTNLFNYYNLVIRGGGMFLQNDPSIEFQPRQIPFVAGDIAPAPNGDGKIDVLDFIALADYWLMEYTHPLWEQKADIAPLPVPDGIINLKDFAAMAAKFEN